MATRITFDQLVLDWVVIKKQETLPSGRIEITCSHRDFNTWKIFECPPELEKALKLPNRIDFWFFKHPCYWFSWQFQLYPDVLITT